MVNETSSGGKASRRRDIDEEAALSPAARLFQEPNFNCHIIAIMGCETSINPSVIKEGLQHTLINHPRFSSNLVIEGRKRKWTRTTVNIEDHVIVPDLDPVMMENNPEQFVEDYISYITTIPMDLSKPLWEVHLLNVKTPDAEAIGVFRVHHSIGDGASLVSLLLACTRKTSDPAALPSIPVQKRADHSRATAGWWCWLWLAIWSALRLICNTIVDLMIFVATVVFLKDTNNPIKGGPGVEDVTKRFVHKTISLDDIKLLKNALNMTINDVILGLTQAALSRYLHRRYGSEGDNKVMQNGGAKHDSNNNLPKNLHIRAAALVNLRPTTGIQALADMMAKESKGRWGNWIGYIILPFTIALQNDPLDYIRVAKAMIDRKKHSLEAFCTFYTAKFVLNAFGAAVAAAIAHRVLSNTTMAFSNVVGPLEEISFYGHPIAYIAPSVYGHPQALTIHFQSYVNKMTVCLAVDPNVIPDPHQLCQDIEESLKIIKDCAVERGLIRDNAATTQV